MIIELLFFGTALGAYLVTAVMYAYEFIRQKSIKNSWRVSFLWLGISTNLLAVVLRTIRSGHLPLAFTYEGNLVIALLTATIFAIWFRKKEYSPTLGIVCMPFVVLVLCGGYLSSPALKPLTAAYFSRWLVVHVLFTMIGTGCLLFAVATSIFYLWKSRYQEQELPARLAKLPSLPVLNNLSLRLVLLGFICWTVMLISGAFWAKDLWGNYWSWDPVETWSFISWLGWGIYVHVHLAHSWNGKRLAWLCLISFTASIISIWGVGLVTPNTYHNLQQITSPVRR